MAEPGRKKRNENASDGAQQHSKSIKSLKSLSTCSFMFFYISLSTASYRLIFIRHFPFSFLSTHSIILSLVPPHTNIIQIRSTESLDYFCINTKSRFDMNLKHLTRNKYKQMWNWAFNLKMYSMNANQALIFNWGESFGYNRSMPLPY